MLCPSCRKKLDQMILYGTEVDYCPICLGIWFEEEELRWAKDEKDKDLQWLDVDLWHDRGKFKIARGKGVCPSCRLPLYEVEYGDSKINVDVCSVCHGVWLDKKEFSRIISYLKAKEKYEVLHKYSWNLAKQFWEIFSGPETFNEELVDFLVLLKLFNYKLAVQHPFIAKIILSLPR